MEIGKTEYNPQDKRNLQDVVQYIQSLKMEFRYGICCKNRMEDDIDDLYLSRGVPT